MRNKIFISIAIAAAVTATSCRKYVEIPVEQQRTLENTADYKALLDNSNNMLRTYSYPLYASDEAGSTIAQWENSVSGFANGNAYTWAEKIIPNNVTDDADWNTMYYSIYVSNKVVMEVLNSKNGTDADKRKIYASALVNRAFYYLTLVNIYAKQYDPATAANDLGLPMRFDDLIEGSLARGSVQAVYDRILSDLNQAIATAELPDLALYTTEASKAAAYGLLARTYLNMRNFTEAGKAADNALKIQSTLLNLNNYTTAVTSYPQRHVDPEVLFCKIANTVTGMPVSDAQVTAFPDTVKDLRYQVFVKPGSFAGTYFAYLPRVYAKVSIANQAYVAGPTVPEVMLIKAECEARAGNADPAMTVLNTLRKTRFKPADYTDLTAANGAAALNQVIAERRRELMGTGMRWFDLRRLNADGLTPVLTRTLKGVTYTLQPGSNRYTFAIADKLISLNPEIQQNPR